MKYKKTLTIGVALLMLMSGHRALALYLDWTNVDSFLSEKECKDVVNNPGDYIKTCGDKKKPSVWGYGYSTGKCTIHYDCVAADSVVGSGPGNGGGIGVNKPNPNSSLNVGSVAVTSNMTLDDYFKGALLPVGNLDAVTLKPAVAGRISVAAPVSATAPIVMPSAAAMKAQTAALTAAVNSISMGKTATQEQLNFLTDPTKYLAGVQYNFAQAYQRLVVQQ